MGWNRDSRKGGTLGYIRGEEGGHGWTTAYAEDAI